MTVQDARKEFGAGQAEMTARWYENVKRDRPDVDAYIATRHTAYLNRWQDAGRFIEDRSRVLDIGGGNLYPALVEFWKRRLFRYSYLDVDPSCVEGAEWLASASDLKDATFDQGYNDSLPYGDSVFDAVFSSHCLEHSFNLEQTLKEVNRVLSISGNLLMAVPLGWELNAQHPYFLGPNEWLSLLTDAGFRIRVAEIGCEYPEEGYDYFVVAQKVAQPGDFRLEPRSHTKKEFTFISPFDERLEYSGKFVRNDDHVVMLGNDWNIEFEVPTGAREVLPILNRHDWSGILNVSWDDQSISEDCYSWFPYVQPVRIEAGSDQPSSLITIRPCGKNPSSLSTEGVMYGVMFR